MRLRLDPTDEYTHPLEADPTFNESMYFNAYDPAAGVGGFFRLGNRANEGYAEMTVCLFLPDGRVGFTFARPEITHNDAFDAGGMRFEVVEPFERLRIAYDGKVLSLTDPTVLVDPRRAFTTEPWVDASVRLEVRGLAMAFGGEPVADDGTPLDLSGGFARGHYEQHIAADGEIRVGEDTWTLAGYGLRDHSWGPRTWQAPWWYRWLTMNFGPDHGFVVSIVTARDGSRRVGGVVLADGVYRHLDGARIDTDWDGPERYHRRLRVEATCGADTYSITGEVLSLVPLRNRRRGPDGEVAVTRITEGMTRWRWDGREGYGLSEYLDQIVDGQPVGAAT